MSLLVLALGASAYIGGAAPLVRPSRVATRMVALSPNPSVSAPTALDPSADEVDAWVKTVDLDAFQADVMALGRKLKAEQGEDDIAHLRKMIGWSNAFGAIGVLSMLLPANPITILALSTWTFSRWTMIAHHTCHGGYNGQDERFNSRVFAVGSNVRRAADWFDWMLPEAWNVEHNNLHHYRLGEKEDPDLVERNLETLREMPLPFAAKRVAVALIAGVWKWFYYAPNTFKQLKIAEAKKAGKALPDGIDPHSALTLNMFVPGLDITGNSAPNGVSGVEFMAKVMLPYLVGHFLLLPAPFVAVGAALGLPAAPLFLNALTNLLLADVVSNLHSFIVIATNHAGDDLYRFEKGPARVNTGTWYMRSVISSANFRTGGDLNDFMHGWLNYQIEHHVSRPARWADPRRGSRTRDLWREGCTLTHRPDTACVRCSVRLCASPPQVWPNLSMLSYQKSAPQLRAICEKHGVPYVQEDVFARLNKLTDIMIGKTSMREYKPQWEKESDFVVSAH